MTKNKIKTTSEIAVEKFKKELEKNGINPSNLSISVWIKEYLPCIYYGKVQITHKQQQLQYDLNEDGFIREVYFRKFKTVKGKPTSVTIPKKSASKMLRNIDDILYETFLDPDLKEMNDHIASIKQG